MRKRNHKENRQTKWRPAINYRCGSQGPERARGLQGLAEVTLSSSPCDPSRTVARSRLDAPFFDVEEPRGAVFAVLGGAPPELVAVLHDVAQHRRAQEDGVLAPRRVLHVDAHLLRGRGRG